MFRVTLSNVEYITYSVGLVLLGLSYYKLKAVIQPEWLFAAACIVWLLLLRLIGAFLKRRFAVNAAEANGD